jgi:hypothetical protein
MIKFLCIVLFFFGENVHSIDLCSVKRRLMADRYCREYYSHFCPFNVNAMMANCFPYPFGFNCGCAHDKKKIISSDIIHKDDYECACVCTKEKY